MVAIPTMKTIKETAKDFNLPVHFVRQLCKEDKICCVKAGNKFLINQEKFADFLNSPSESKTTEQGKIRRIGA